jgi:hypothetical protein
MAEHRRETEGFPEELLREVRRLGDEYDPLDVVAAAATLIDPEVLVRHITAPGLRKGEPDG